MKMDLHQMISLETSIYHKPNVKENYLNFIDNNKNLSKKTTTFWRF